MSDGASKGSEKVEQEANAAPAFRKGVFPRTTLSKALELVKAIMELGHGDPVPRLDVYDHLGRKDGGSTRTLVAAANSGYGLTTGNSGSAVLGLTEAGLRIAAAKNKTERLSAIFDALMANEIYASLVDKYSGRTIPSDGAVVYHLQNSHGLAESEAEACWKVMKANLEEYGPNKVSSGTLYVVSPSEALASATKSVDTARSDETVEGEEAAGTNGEVSAPVAEAPSSTARVVQVPANGVQPQFHFNIQVVLPENATPETYEAIFKSIGDNLLYRSDD